MTRVGLELKCSLFRLLTKVHLGRAVELRKPQRVDLRRHPPYRPGVDRRRFILTALAGALAAPLAAVSALLIVIPCLYFESWDVWRQWYRFVYGSNPSMLVRPIAQGNYSTALLLATWLGVDVWTVTGAMSLAIAAAAVVVIAVSVMRATTAPARPATLLRAAVAKTVEDPRLTMAIGITVTIAICPLFWYHY